MRFEFIGGWEDVLKLRIKAAEKARTIVQKARAHFFFCMQKVPGLIPGTYTPYLFPSFPDQVALCGPQHHWAHKFNHSVCLAKCYHD